MEKSGMKNKYVCQSCGKSIITLNVNDGTTPFAIACRASPACVGLMYSQFYGVDQRLPAQFEWFKPDTLEGYSREMKEHIENGGLVLRERPTSKRKKE